MNAYTRLIELHASGETPLYRRRDWRKVDQAREKRGKREIWYKKRTPGSQLKHRYMKEIKETGFKVRVVEQSGTTLNKSSSRLQKSDPFKPKRCATADCLVCRTDGKGSCRSTGVTYELVRKACCNKCIVETSRITYTRGKEHPNALEHREERSVMWKHSCDRHGGNVPEFVMNVTGT